MSLAQTVMVFVLLAGAGITLAAWGPVEDLGYAGASIGLLGGVSAENAPAIGDEPPAGCTDARGPGVVEITALDRAFSTDCLIVSGDQRISLVNEDSLPHTLTITGDATYSPPFLLDLDESLGKQTLTSEPVDGSVEPGGWPFVCRYHTWMAGQIWVR